jgi:IclR family transcriptional regulator, KDG regulon repressor
MARVLRSVNNALAVLESFSVERPEIGVTELSHTLGLGKSTVHRLLTSLASRGYVRKNPETERYCLGFKAFEVGSLAAGRGSIRDVAAPFLRSLMLATKETVHLGVLDEWEVVYIDKIESDHPLQMYSRVGRRAPLHCTALGKSLAAWETDDWLDRFLRVACAPTRRRP